jgi:hypothetical protein
VSDPVYRWLHVQQFIAPADTRLPG